MSTPAGFKDIENALTAKGIGMVGWDEELQALVVGGLDGKTEYMGVRIEKDEEEEFIVVLEVIFSGPFEEEEEARAAFDELYGDLVEIEDDDLELDYDEEEEVWGTELLRATENVDDLVESVVDALEHGLYFQMVLEDGEEGSTDEG